MHVDLVAGDRTPFIRTCKQRSTGALIDLSASGWIAKLIYRMDGGLLVSRDLSIVSPGTLGQVRFDPDVGQEWVAGELIGEIELTDFDGKKYTELETFTENIRPKI